MSNEDRTAPNYDQIKEDRVDPGRHEESQQDIGEHKASRNGGSGNGHGAMPTAEELFFAHVVKSLRYGPSEIIADDEIHRFGEDGDDSGKTPGWYALHLDDPVPYGVCGDWRLGDEKFTWRGDNTRDLTPEEKAEHERRRAERRNAEKRKQREAAEQCAQLYEILSKDPVNPHFLYLEKKNVGAHGIIELKWKNRWLIGIPVREDGERIVSLQWIDFLGRKVFERAGKTSGCWFAIGNPYEAPLPIIVICEGYATGATIFETTGLPVIVAFSAGNIKAVAISVAKKYPGMQIVIAGDDDFQTEQKLGKNAGVLAAREAAAAVDGVAVFPPFDCEKDRVEPSDWNDLAALRGKENVGEIFRQEIEKAKQYRMMRDRIDMQRTHSEHVDRSPTSPDNSSESEPRRAVIQLSTDLSADLSACVDVLLNSPTVEIYQRGGNLVMRGRVKYKTHDGKEVEDSAILQHNAESLRPVLAEAAIFAKWNSREKIFEECYPPRDLTSALANCGVLDERFPVLRGVTSIPTLRADGSILNTPGYDPASGLYFDPKGLDFGVLPDWPTKADAEDAIKQLEALICEFPFVDEPSRSVAIALLTGVSRYALKCALMFEYVAPAPRTGKSKLNDIGCMITDGHEAPVISASSNREEREKQLVAMARSGAQTITLDNLPNGEALSSELLCQMLSQEILEVRPFFANDKTVKIPNTALVVVNGNNIGVSADLTERAVRCGLDAKMELPGLRKFDFDPVEMVRADRAKYVRACLIILRAHAVVGYPMPDNSTPLGGFEDWNKKIRGALLWLNRADPCETMADVREEDPQRGGLLAVMEEWHAVFGNRLVTVAEVIAKAEELAQDEGRYNCYGKYEITKRGKPALLNALEEVAIKDKGHISAKSLGRWIKSNLRVIMNGRQFAIKPHKGKTKAANKIALIGNVDDIEKSEDYSTALVADEKI